MGTRKLYTKIKPFLEQHGIKMGRDGLFKLLSAHSILIRRRKRRIQTTQSLHWLRKYPNLIKDFVPTAINQLWVSDITYWKLQSDTHVYISFITDAYSRRIVGYHVASTLETVETIQALSMAVSQLKDGTYSGLIHHSDRGVQYCSKDYVKLLQDNSIGISMTQSGDPLENALAERLNGIIKQEYLSGNEVKTIEQASEVLKKSVELYNSDRPHMSIGNLTPNHVHYAEQAIPVSRLWKNYYPNYSSTVNESKDLKTPVNLMQD